MAVNETLNLKVQNTISEISVNVICIPEDRLENILIKHVANFKRSKDIIGASGTFLAILTTFLTSDFKDFGLEAETWKGVFIVAMVASAIYFFYVLWNLLNNRGGVEKVMLDIKSAKSEICNIDKTTNLTNSQPQKKNNSRHKKRDRKLQR